MASEASLCISTFTGATNFVNDLTFVDIHTCMIFRILKYFFYIYYNNNYKAFVQIILFRICLQFN